MPWHDHAGEGRPVEQRRRQHVHDVEPAARLPDVLDDEVGGECSSNHSWFSNG
jgi:hypothetical protein